MVKLMVATAAAAFVFDLALASAAPLPGPSQAPAAPMTTLAAAKRMGVIPANCTMDPYKKVYRCCTDGVCTEYPLDHDFPLQQRLQQVRPLQTQPMILMQPGASQ